MWEARIFAKDKTYNIEFVVKGWPREVFQRAGHYTFEFTPDHHNLPEAKGGWFDTTCPPLTCGFVVEEAQPCKIVARWEVLSDEDKLPLVRVGERPPAIILQLQDENNMPVS